jgi:aspartate kinase
MKVFKFGGASVKNAQAVKNVSDIITSTNQKELVVVVSAMGKTTNALEDIVSLAYQGKEVQPAIETLYRYHLNIANELFINSESIKEKLEKVFLHLHQNLNTQLPYDVTYDQIVSLGEILSTLIVADYVGLQAPTQWLDARDCIVTNSSYREGKVDWPATNKKMQHLAATLSKSIIVTQGFIGRATDGLTTTLGREGSDYTAAIFASCLKAESVTIWKDVPGVMNADPKRLPAAIVFEELPFQEAAEMTYYGASVIHPKTIKPLANANIPLLVKSFDNPTEPGTQIFECRIEKIPPLIVFKDNQCLISCKVTDYTFVSEDQLSSIFKTLSDHEVKINMMQNSAISFSLCVDYRESKIRPLIEELSQNFEVYYNTNLTLITIKNYTAQLSEEYRSKPGILLEQLSRSTLQILVKANAPAGGEK